MLLNLKGFSQIDTNKKNDSIVTLPKFVATKIAKDLVELDKLRITDTLKSETIVLLKRQVLTKDSLAVSFNKMYNLSNQQYINASKRYDLLNELYFLEKKKVKKQKFKTTISQIALVVLGVFFALK